MVQSKSTSRLSRISQAIILTQTDTTVGFVSKNDVKLQAIKSRPPSKPFLKVFTSNKKLLASHIRIPQKYKNTLRRAKKTSFVVKSTAFRIANYPSNSQLLRNLQWTYSTSANASGEKFSFDFCEDKTDIIVHDKEGFSENSSSTLLKINNSKKVRLR